jgi:hypothetical protein
VELITLAPEKDPGSLRLLIFEPSGKRGWASRLQAREQDENAHKALSRAGDSGQRLTREGEELHSFTMFLQRFRFLLKAGYRPRQLPGFIDPYPDGG